MRLISFERGGMTGCGRLDGEKITPFLHADGNPLGMKTYLRLRQQTDGSVIEGDSVPASEARFLPPVPNPGKIFCIATNFIEPHNEGKPLPDYPLLFTRFADSVVGHMDDLIKPIESDRYDFEGEVAVVIDRPSYRVRAEDAMGHVLGYSCFNDGSVRDWQKHSSQFTPGKNFYRSASFGPWIVTKEEIPDPSSLSLETRVNDVVRQSITLDRFIFNLPWLIAYITTFSPLDAGDVIVTGTPSGFGSSRQPPEFLSVGDVVEVSVTGLGTLRNRVHSPLKSISK